MHILDAILLTGVIFAILWFVFLISCNGQNVEKRQTYQ